jgi:hypothetical protein
MTVGVKNVLNGLVWLLAYLLFCLVPLGHWLDGSSRSLKVATRVRIPLGLQIAVDPKGWTTVMRMWPGLSLSVRPRIRRGAGGVR